MITLRNVSKAYNPADQAQLALDSVSLTIAKGEVFGIIGFSGGGKSTLLRTINLLEKPDTGEIIVDGKSMLELSALHLRQARQSIAMIFQNFHLFHNRTVSQNISYPLEISGVSRQKRKQRIAECLEVVNLQEKADVYPAQLSGGQKQRVAIARAIATRPSILLCDEPTSALDPLTTADVLACLRKLNTELGITIVIVTHEMEVVKQLCHKVAVIDQGRIVETLIVSATMTAPQTETARLLFGVKAPEGVFPYVR